MPKMLLDVPERSDVKSPRPIVLVHGGLHGGWCWRDARAILVAAGHTVFTPTLTGLGERAHLAAPAIGLAVHVEDVAGCIACEEISDVVLVGHSYGGMVVTGVVDRMIDRIAHLVYLDGLVPTDGQSVVDIDPSLGAFGSDDAPLQPPPSYDFGLTDPDQIAWVRRRLTPQAARTVTERLALHQDLSRIERWYIECADRGGDLPLYAIRRIAAERRADPDWHYARLDAPHDCMISHPHATADRLLAIARTQPATGAKRKGA